MTSVRCLRRVLVANETKSLSDQFYSYLGLTVTVRHGTVHPETVCPETVHPEIVYPETIHPETVHPEAIHPETIHPETIHPEDELSLRMNCL